MARSLGDMPGGVPDVTKDGNERGRNLTTRKCAESVEIRPFSAGVPEKKRELPRMAHGNREGPCAETVTGAEPKEKARRTGLLFGVGPSDRECEISIIFLITYLAVDRLST